MAILDIQPTFNPAKLENIVKNSEQNTEAEIWDVPTFSEEIPEHPVPHLHYHDDAFMQYHSGNKEQAMQTMQEVFGSTKMYSSERSLEESAERVASFIEDYQNSDLSVSEIAEKYDVSTSTVSRWAKKAQQVDHSLLTRSIQNNYAMDKAIIALDYFAGNSIEEIQKRTLGARHYTLSEQEIEAIARDHKENGIDTSTLTKIKIKGKQEEESYLRSQEYLSEEDARKGVDFSLISAMDSLRTSETPVKKFNSSRLLFPYEDLEPHQLLPLLTKKEILRSVLNDTDAWNTDEQTTIFFSDSYQDTHNRLNNFQGKLKADEELYFGDSDPFIEAMDRLRSPEFNETQIQAMQHFVQSEKIVVPCEDLPSVLLNQSSDHLEAVGNFMKDHGYLPVGSTELENYLEPKPVKVTYPLLDKVKTIGMQGFKAAALLGLTSTILWSTYKLGQNAIYPEPKSNVVTAINHPSKSKK